MKKGQTWNESSLYQDPITLRNVRRLTSRGLINTVPSYHTDQSFTRDGKQMIFITYRDGQNALCKANLNTGDLTCLIHPIDGLGGLHEQHLYGNGNGIPIGAVLAPNAHWAFYVVAYSIRAVHIDTLEEKVLVPQVSKEFYIESLALSCDEQYLLYVLVSLAPASMYHEVHRIRLADGRDDLLLDGHGFNVSHCMQNPIYPSLFLIGRDTGPSPSHRIDENSRNWIYNMDSGEMTNVKTVALQNFQTHAAWAWDGQSVIYHGMLDHSTWYGNLNETGWYIGTAGLDGTPIREYSFPKAPYYGHVSAMKGRNATILDGNIMDGCLLLLSFDDEKPQVEVLARHDSDFTLMPGQCSHPHTICSPDGKYLAFNSARRVIFSGGRSDVYAVEIEA